MKTLSERFFEKTEHDPATGCRIWQGAKSAAGLGVMTLSGRSRNATSVAIELSTGTAPASGLRVRPTCGNRLCVETSHLRVGPPAGRSDVSIADRLAALASVCPETGCHLFTGPLNADGYGVISIDGRTFGAHRVAYELHKGSIGPGLICRHRCDTPRCINTDHLEVGTVADNSKDRVERGKSTRGSRVSLPRLGAADRALMLRAVEAGYSHRSVRHGWALSTPGFKRALRIARQEPQAAAQRSPIENI